MTTKNLDKMFEKTNIGYFFIYLYKFLEDFFY